MSNQVIRIGPNNIRSVGEPEIFSDFGNGREFAESLGNPGSLEFAFLPGYSSSVRANSGDTMFNSVEFPASGAKRDDYFMLSGNGPRDAAAMPTFTGSIDGQSSSEYFLYDGGDYNCCPMRPEFLNTLHKDGAKFTILYAFYHITNAGDNYAFATTNSAVRNGLIWHPSVNKMRFMAMNATGYAILHIPSTTLTGSAWNIVGVTVDESAAHGISIVNGTVNWFTSTYVSPSTTDASVFTLGGYNMNASIVNGSRIGDVVVWNDAMSQSDLEAASSVLETKYGV